MATVTDPIMLDSTGQDIVTALGNLNTPRDTAAYTTSFASSDTDDASATSWTVVSPIAGGETHATLFGKLSQIAKNVRYLYKMLGNTDLSAIADGTVTGAIDYLYTWKPLCDVTGSTETPFPTTWNEIDVLLIMPSGQCVKMRIIPSDVTTSNRLITVSYYYASTTMAWFAINVNSSTGIKLSNVYSNISGVTLANMRMVCKYR